MSDYVVGCIRALWHGEPVSWDSAEALAATIWFCANDLAPQIERACAFLAASGQADHPLYTAFSPVVGQPAASDHVALRSLRSLRGVAAPLVPKSRSDSDWQITGQLRGALYDCIRRHDRSALADPVLPIVGEVGHGCLIVLDHAAVPAGYEAATCGQRTVVFIDRTREKPSAHWVWVDDDATPSEITNYELLSIELQAKDGPVTARDLARADMLHRIMMVNKSILPITEGLGHAIDVPAAIESIVSKTLLPSLKGDGDPPDVARAIGILRAWAHGRPAPENARVSETATAPAARRPRL